MSKTAATTSGASFPPQRWMLILVIVSIVLALVAIGLSFRSQQRIAYVKVGLLLEKYKGMIDAKAQYKLKESGWQANVDTLAAEFEREFREFERKRGSMTARERSLAEQLLQNKQQQAMQYRSAMQQKAQEEDRKLTEQVLSTVNAYLERYGRTKSYSIILGANPSGNILYGDPGEDITEEIIEGLNAEYTPAAPPTQAPAPSSN